MIHGTNGHMMNGLVCDMDIQEMRERLDILSDRLEKAFRRKVNGFIEQQERVKWTRDE